jgi:hypothetical protein
MNSFFFYTKIQMPKLDANYKNHVGSIDEFLSSWHRFIGLDENTTNHDYLNYKICH